MKNQEMLPPIQFRVGKRLYLRPILKEDMGMMTVWINDPEVTQFLKAFLPMTPEDELKWFESLNERKPSDIVFAIVLKESDEHIGTIGLHGVDFRNGIAKTGSFIGNKKYWGKGFGTEAKMILLEYAFNTLNLRKICSVVYDFNGRSKRCLEKCGYHEEGILKQHLFRNGSHHDAFQMAVFRDEFFPIWEMYRKKFLE